MIKFFSRMHIFNVFMAFAMLPLVFFVDFSLPLVLGAIVMYYAYSLIGVHIGNHKYWTHQEFEAGPLAEWLMTVCVWLGAQGHPAPWSAAHIAHHCTDKMETDDDPIYRSAGRKSLIRTIFYNHSLPFQINGDPAYAVYFWSIPAVLAHVACGIGVIYSHKPDAGTQPYMFKGDRGQETKATNVDKWWFMHIVWCGAQYENNHHYDPDRANWAMHDGEFDVSYQLIKLLRAR
jgi:fatty-acid desaturase